MNKKIREKLMREAERLYSTNDPAHDFAHIQRVLAGAEMLQSKEGGDLEIIIPSAIFHDVVCYPKNGPLRSHSAVQSAHMAEEILLETENYPHNKISAVKEVIKGCSFTKGRQATSQEEMIVRDADLLEGTGAIDIMRMFSYSGTINRAFYSYKDPLAKERDLDDLKYTIDLFFTRAYKIPELLHTKTAKQIAERRVAFMEDFIKELQLEMKEVNLVV